MRLGRAMRTSPCWSKYVLLLFVFVSALARVGVAAVESARDRVRYSAEWEEQREGGRVWVDSVYAMSCA